MSAEHITDTQFEQEVLKSELPVVVDFFAEWCGPCKMSGPILDELADEYKDKVKIVKVDVDQSELAGNYGIMSIPTVLVFQGGKVMEVQGQPLRVVGFGGKEKYVALISQAMGAK